MLHALHVLLPDITKCFIFCCLLFARRGQIDITSIGHCTSAIFGCLPKNEALEYALGAYFYNTFTATTDVLANSVLCAMQPCRYHVVPLWQPIVVPHASARKTWEHAARWIAPDPRRVRAYNIHQLLNGFWDTSVSGQFTAWIFTDIAGSFLEGLGSLNRVACEVCLSLCLAKLAIERIPKVYDVAKPQNLWSGK